MSEHAFISIIVPVYGVEAYLPACVDSLLAQTHRHLEILLIDDGSPDRCGGICDAYAALDSRVRVIHKPNGGAASARNAGLDAARGDYICFVDSDDLVAPDYVQSLLAHLQADDADIAVCGFTQFTRAGALPPAQIEPAGLYDRDGYLLQFLKSWSCALLWNKLYRRQVIGSLRMAEGHRIDDEFFTYQTVLNAGRITVFDRPLYQYRLRASGVMRNVDAHRERVMLDHLEYMLQRYDHIQTHAPVLEGAYFADVLDSFARYWAGCRQLPAVRRRIRRWAGANFMGILGARLPLKQRLAYIRSLYLCRPGDHTPLAASQTPPETLFP